MVGAVVARSPLGAVPGVVAFGLGLGLVFPSAFAWVEALAPADRQGQFTSYLASSGYTGQFLSPVLFGPIVPLFGVRGVFGVAGALAAGARSSSASSWHEGGFSRDRKWGVSRETIAYHTEGSIVERRFDSRRHGEGTSFPSRIPWTKQRP